MADINKNVGSTAPSQDYATLTLWNAGEGAADPGVGFKSIANCYGNCGSTATINGAFVRGAIVQGSVLYDGSNQSSLSTVARVNVSTADLTIKHMKLTNNNAFDNAVDLAAANCFVEDSHVEDSSTSSLSYGATQIRGAAVNKGLLRVTIDATCAQLIRTGFGGPVTLNNVTGWGATSRGVLGPSGGEGDMTDCFFFDCNSAAVGGTWASKTNIATDDATGDLNPYTSSELVDFAGDNYQVKSTSFLATAGIGGGVVGAYLEVSSGTSVTVDPIGQAQTIDQVTLTQHPVLTIGGLSQAQTIDQVTLQQGGVLSLNNLDQIQTIGQVNLTQAHIVTVDDLSQTQTLEQIVLSTIGAGTVAINDLSQNQLLDQLNLTQAHVVSIDNLSQSQLLDSINFNGVVVGYLQGALTIVSAYNGQIKLTNPLTGEIRIL